MKKQRGLVIVGDSIFAQIAYEYFTHDSEYEVIAFSVEDNYRKKQSMFGLPVVAFESLESAYPPDRHSVFAALVFTQSNRLRARLYRAAKEKGYAAASYLSSQALLARSCEIGEHCFVCEATVIQPHAKIGSNVVLWSGNDIGHHASIGSNCFTLPNATIGEFANIGENCVVGANAAILPHTTIADHSFIEPGALIAESTQTEKAT